MAPPFQVITQTRCSLDRCSFVQSITVTFLISASAHFSLLVFYIKFVEEWDSKAACVCLEGWKNTSRLFSKCAIHIAVNQRIDNTTTKP